MNLLIPVDCDKRYEALLTTQEESKYWAFVVLQEGQIESCKFLENRSDIECYIETIVLINEQEYGWQFQEESIIGLVAPTQRSIDEIVEAFLLKQLHPINS